MDEESLVIVLHCRIGTIPCGFSRNTEKSAEADFSVSDEQLRKIAQRFISE
jgi:hypothetical protein